MAAQIFPIVSQPGIQRDGTNFASRMYIDGQWCRFQRGLPRKIGGYTLLTSVANIPRGLFTTPCNLILPGTTVGLFNLYIGSTQGVLFYISDENGNIIQGETDISPVGFSASANPLYVWQFDVIFSTTDETNYLIAFCSSCLDNINDSNKYPVYYNDINSVQPLVAINTPLVSGGFAIFHPYLFTFGEAGVVSWSEENNPTSFLPQNEARIASQKIIYGLPTRGGNSSPAGLFWSLDSLIRVTFIGGEQQFRFDTISNECSILSSRSVVEYDGLYFWAGTDRFLVYNGIVQELPNRVNLNYFFDNLNYEARQKVWASVNSQYGEIWWFYPSGNNTECDRAVIYNKRDNSWYDTAIARGCGYADPVFSSPIWADNAQTQGNNYGIWIHEDGYDQDVDGVLTAIDSYFETGDIAWAAIGPTGQWTGADRWVALFRVEPDFNMDGDLDLTIRGREYANSPIIESEIYSFNNQTLFIDVRQQRREMTLKFDSNQIGGFYELGQTLLTLAIGDARP